jgi:hypothetical protein
VKKLHQTFFSKLVKYKFEILLVVVNLPHFLLRHDKNVYGHEVAKPHVQPCWRVHGSCIKSKHLRFFLMNDNIIVHRYRSKP